MNGRGYFEVSNYKLEALNWRWKKVDNAINDDCKESHTKLGKDESILIATCVYVCSRKYELILNCAYDLLYGASAHKICMRSSMMSYHSDCNVGERSTTHAER